MPMMDPATVIATRVVCYMEDSQLQIFQGCLRKQHETFNSSIKCFNILKNNFRHDISQLSGCFCLCSIAVQLSLHYNKMLYGVLDTMTMGHERFAEEHQLAVAAGMREMINPTSGEEAEEDDEENDYDDDDISIDYLLND